MIIKSFEFPSNVPLSYSQDGSEETWGFPIEFGNNYSFIIGKRDKPTAEEKARIEAGFARAWEGIFRSSPGLEVVPPNYTIAVIHDPAGEKDSGLEPETPLLSSGRFYLLCVLSDSAGSEMEDEEITRQITQAIEGQFGRISPRIGVVTLYNASVTILSGFLELPKALRWARGF